jgi:hypothetical protein
MLRIMLVVALGACSIPEKHLSDAAGGPYECLGQPLPSTADAKITISGHVSDPFTGNPINGGAVEGYLVGVPSSIFTTTTDATGAFAHDQGTGGVPRNAYLKMTANGFLDAYFFPSAPLAHSMVQDRLTQMTSSDIQTIGQVANVTIDPTKVQLVVVVVDCNGNAVPGATISTTPPGTIRYFEAATPSATAVATDSMTGAALVANLAPSNTTINATVQGMTLRSHNFDTVAGALMQTEIQP